VYIPTAYLPHTRPLYPHTHWCTEYIHRVHIYVPKCNRDQYVWLNRVPAGCHVVRVCRHMSFGSVSVPHEQHRVQFGHDGYLRQDGSWTTSACNVRMPIFLLPEISGAHDLPVVLLEMCLLGNE
jgi:hypothetical protein